MSRKTSLIFYYLFLFGSLLLVRCLSVPENIDREFDSERTKINGRVMDENLSPVEGAVVRVKTTQLFVISDAEGRFFFPNLDPNQQEKITAWSPGYFIGGGDSVTPGSEEVEIVLVKHHTIDNPEYEWLTSLKSSDGHGENQGCAKCHSNEGSDITTPLPVDEWLLDAHSQSAVNQRFLSMYIGSDLAGNKSPPTRFANSVDYGTLPLPPDDSQPYYGPGYKLDFPGQAGNCAACHVPLDAIHSPYGVDPTAISDIAQEGVSCDFCHKISDIKLSPATGLPLSNMPGVLSYEFLRPPDGHQFFAGPLDDVAPGEDTYLPLERESQFCAGCHYGVFWDTSIYNSFGEWLESPYSDPETGQTCQDCHMVPSGVRMFALPESGGEDRDPATLFSHRMPGASDIKLLQNALTMNVNVFQDDHQIIVEVTLLNEKTGHHVPTDSPLRHLLLLVEAQNPDGMPLPLVEGPTLPDWAGKGDPELGYFAGLPGKAYAKVLKELWTEISPTGAYWNPTSIVSDNRLGVNDSDKTQYVFTSQNEDPITIIVKLFYRRAYIDLMDQKSWDVPDILMEYYQSTLDNQH